MPKRSREQIRKDENRIIKELTTNANESINKIAKKCGFSRQKVWRIVKRLEKNNIIWGYVTIVDKERLNRKGFVMLIKRTNKPIDEKLLNNILNRKLDEIADEIDVEIEDSHYIHGVYDWMICINAKDIKHAKKMCESFNTEFGEHIEEIDLIEKMFPIKKCGIDNPNIEEIEEFTTF